MRTVSVAFGVHPFACTGASIPASMPAIGSGLPAICRGTLQRLTTDLGTDRLRGFLRGLVAPLRRVVAQLGVMIALLGCAISAICRLIASIGVVL
jgi:hypothetical protein